MTFCQNYFLCTSLSRTYVLKLMKAPNLMKLQINLLCLSKFEANSTEGWTLLKGKLFLHEHKKTWIHDQMHCTKIFINLCFTWTFHGWNKAISDYIRSTSFISVIGECVNVESNMNAAQQRHIRVIILTSGNAVLHTNTAPLWFVTFHLSSMVSLPISPPPRINSWRTTEKWSPKKWSLFWHGA